MNRISKHKNQVLSREALVLKKKMDAIADWLEQLAYNRTREPLGHLMVSVGQSEGLKEAASVVRKWK